MLYRGLRLDPFQEQAIQALQRGETVLVCAPTGTGKTLVADWMVEEILGRGQQVVYTAPIKALSNQKFRDYCRMLGPDRVGLVTGDLVIRPEAPCRVMTTEILRNQLLTGQPLQNLGGIIVDEIHFLDDAERGTVWEELLIYLPAEIPVVGLSATLSNLDEFAGWLRSVRGHEVTVVEEHRRAVPLRFLVATRELGLREPAEMKDAFRRWQHQAQARPVRPQDRRRRGRQDEPSGHPTRHADVFRMLDPERLPYLYFVQSRRDAEGMARGLLGRMQQAGRSLLDGDEERRVLAALKELQQSPTGGAALDADLAALYRRGVGFHHAGLHVSLKALVEELYEQRLIKVLYCTGTFALGINMPARCAVFDKMERYDGREMIPLPAREFMQMAGRAGRRGMDDEGLVIVRTDIDAWPEIEKQLHRYLQGQLEPVRSRFGLSLHSVINLLSRYDLAHIRTLVEKSFLSFHRQHRGRREQEEARALAARLEAQGWQEGLPVPGSLRADVHHLRKLKTRALERGDATWDEFQARVDWLLHWGYIRPAEEGDEPGPAGYALGIGAKVLKELAFCEVMLTEMVLEGVAGELPMPELFGVLCGMVNSLPRGVFTHGKGRHQGIARRVNRIRYSDPVQTAEQLSRQPVTWDPAMIPFGVWWAEGQPLSWIMEQVQAPTDISGELVGAFRRARDLAQQLRNVYRTQDPTRAEDIQALLRTTRRDEVEVVD